MDVVGSIIGAVISLIRFLLKWAIKLIVWLVMRLWRLIKARPRTFGKAHFASTRQLRRGGFLGERGLIIGKAMVNGGQLVRFCADGHATVIAPPRQGKGVNFVIPNLLDHMGSVIVTDPKAENRDITIRHRETLGSVYALDLMTPANSDQFNPLDMIRVGTENEIDDAELIADLLITPDPRSAAHWDDKARQGLTGFILYMVHCVDPVLRTLPELRRLVYQEPAAFQHTLMEMAEVPIDACQGAANDLLAMLKTDEGQSVFSSMRKALRLWSIDRPAGHVVSNSSFSLMSFKREVATLYIIIAPDKMQLYAPFMRLFAGLSLAAMTRDQYRPEYPVLVMLDEARLLGRLDLLPETIAVSSGYGVRVVPIWQDIGQVKELYGDDSIVTQCALQIYFGVNKAEYAKALCDRIGQYTVHMHSTGQSGQVDEVIHAGRSRGQSEAGRPLIYPFELMQSSDVFAFVPKFPPIRCAPAPYYREKRWKGLFDYWGSPQPTTSKKTSQIVSEAA